jgi:hypothetical protein
VNLVNSITWLLSSGVRRSFHRIAHKAFSKNLTYMVEHDNVAGCGPGRGEE